MQADRVASALHLRLAEQGRLAPEALVALVRAMPGASLSPAGVLKVPLPPGAGPLPALEDVLDALGAAVGAPPALAL